jgi:aspartyl protease family protein
VTERRTLAGAVAAAALAGLLPLGLPSQAQTQNLSLGGRLGDKALLVIDGQPQLLAPGQSARGVRLIELRERQARVEQGGQVLTLDMGQPAQVGSPQGSASGTRIVLSASSGGHFETTGSINGKSVPFLVDTGATLVTLSRDLADRIGLDYQNGPRTLTQTANGTAGGWRVSLASVRIRDVEVHQIDAMVLEQPMPVVLLGNSFLSRFNLQREGSQMVLSRR